MTGDAVTGMITHRRSLSGGCQRLVRACVMLDETAGRSRQGFGSSYNWDSPALSFTHDQINIGGCDGLLQCKMSQIGWGILVPSPVLSFTRLGQLCEDNTWPLK